MASAGGAALAAPAAGASVARHGGVTDRAAVPRPSTTPVASPGIYAPPDVVVGASDGSVDLPVTLDAPGQSTVTVNYSTPNGTGYGNNTSCAYSTSAFVATSGTLTFAPGTTTQTVQVTLLDCHHSLSLGFQTFYLTLSSNSSDSTIVRAVTQVDITGDAAAASTPGLYVRDAVADATASSIQVPVVLGGPSGAAQGVPVTVNYTTADGSAKAGTDYTAVSGTLTFPPGETAQNITIPVLSPSGAVPARSFSVTLSSASNAAIAYGTGTVTLEAGAGTPVPLPGILAPPDLVAGANDGYVDLAVTLSAPGESTVTVSWITQNGTGYGNNEACNYGTSAFVDESGTLTFPPGVTTQVVRVPVLDCQHSLGLGFQTFYLSLSSSSTGSTITRAVTQVDVTGDQAASSTPSLSVGDLTVDASAGAVRVPVLLGGPSGAAQGVPVTVGYTTRDGSATAGTDYTAVSGTLTFPPGETAQNITVPVIRRAGSAATRSFSVTISAPSNATVADDTGVVTIGASGAGGVAAPSISVPTAVVVGEADGYVDLPVTLSAPGQSAVTVPWTTVNGTGYGNNEACNYSTSVFVDESGTLTFPPGVTTQVVRVPVLNCPVTLPLTFTLKLSSATGGTVGGTGTTTVTVVSTATVPGAPTGVTAAAVGSGSATVSFIPPASDGGDPVNSYTVTASPGGATATGPGSPITVTGLSSGTTYTFTVTATNSVGTGPASAASNPVTPGVTVPGAPTGVTATAGNAKVTLAWKAPASSGGSAIKGYWVYAGTASGTESATPVNTTPITGTSYAVSGLTDGTTYYFTIKAQNGSGYSPASAQVSAVPSPVNFTAKPGTATGISVGADGVVWAVGTTTVTGGYQVLKWSGTTWSVVSGAGAIAIAVDPAGHPWILTSAHKIEHWSGSTWTGVTGSARGISVGADGVVWAVGTTAVTGGYQVLKWSGTKWSVVDGAGAVAIAVDPVGHPYIVTSAHKIEHWSGSTWTAFTGTATVIAVGKDGKVWSTGTTAVAGGYPVYEWTGSAWLKSSGVAVAVAVDPLGNPWIVNSAHKIYFG